MSMWYAYLFGTITTLALVLLGYNVKIGFWIYVVIAALTIVIHVAFKVGEGWAEKKAELDKKP